MSKHSAFSVFVPVTLIETDQLGYRTSKNIYSIDQLTKAIKESSGEWFGRDNQEIYKENLINTYNLFASEYNFEQNDSIGFEYLGASSYWAPITECTHKEDCGRIPVEFNAKGYFCQWHKHLLSK